MSPPSRSSTLAGVENVPRGGGGACGTQLTLLKANKLALVGLVLTIFFLLVGLVGADPAPRRACIISGRNSGWQRRFSPKQLAPSRHRPVRARPDVAYDRRVGIAVLIGVGVTAVVIVIGLAFGSLAGYYGGRRDTAIAGLIDLTWGLPCSSWP
jgi:hypothetical protein